MEHDQYLDAETIMRYCRGEFWGITRLNLLHGERFDERTSAENSLWCKLNLHAHRFYIHRGLRIYHTEGNDRVTQFYRKLESKDWEKYNSAD
jgi:hypothetical protein